MSHKLELKDLDKCVGCGECNIACPIFQIQRLESSGPRGKLYFLALRNNGDLSDISPEVLKQCSEVFFNCTLCGACIDVCDSKVSILEHLEAERGNLIKQDFRPELVHLQKRIVQAKNLYGLDNDDRTEFSNLSELIEQIPALQDKIYPNCQKAQVVFFLGCLTYFRSEFMKPLESAIKLLEHLGVDYLLLGGEEYCCGQPILAMGLEDELDPELKSHNLTMFNEIEAEMVITNCPGCLTTLKRLYGETNALQFLHLTEYLDERLDKYSDSLQIQAVYHDSCELAHLNNIKDPPRSLLKKLGVELIEVEQSCCGGGGLLRASNAELSEIIAQKKIQEQKLDQYPLITCCPSCIEQFKANNVEAYDLFEFLLQIVEGDINAT